MTQIRCFAEIGHGAEVRAALDTIFFDNSATREFDDEVSRRKYHDLWLGRYLEHFPESCFVAIDESDHGGVIGYVAGSLLSDREPLPGPEYYRLFPANFLEKFPAHMHVNVRKDRQGQRIGSALIGAFREHCRERNMAGCHAVTVAHRCPATFFVRCGMTVQARVQWHYREIVFIGERLQP
jgi:GNAT superfamily N-acetyltransferase